MIPKIIHYCWFGQAPFPALVEKCIASWKKYCPDYEIKLWNETNFDVNCNFWVKEAYAAKKYAFVADYVRLWAISEYGGIYMDTDVEVLKSLDPFLIHPAFIGFESSKAVAICIIGSEKGGVWAASELKYYEGRHFLLENSQMNCMTNAKIITEHLVQDGLQLNNCYQEHKGIVTVYPQEYFSPKSFHGRGDCFTENTCTVHWFEMSWHPWHKKLKRRWKNFRRGIGNFLKKALFPQKQNRS